MNAALMHAAVNLLQDQQNPKEQHPIRCNAGCTPVVVKTTDDTPATTNSTRRTPTVAARAWHYTAMPTAAFVLSAILAYVATETIFKRISGRN